MALLGIFFLSSISGLDPVAAGTTDKKDFVINPGDSFKDIAAGLKSRDLIKSAGWFKLYSLLAGQAQQFKPGLYQLSPSQSGIEIIEVLVRGPEDVTVVIQEGATLVDIDRQLAGEGIIKKEGLVDYNRLRQLAGDKSLEGFLFPDTYRLARGAPISSIVSKFLDNFERRMGGVDYEDLILASLLEKEASHPEDRALAAGILKKRLQLAMPLQVDAANVYIKCQGAYVSCPDEQRQLSRADLKINDPYNTYIYKGLPPAPIANPGKEALQAARRPQPSSYLYYLSDPKTGRLVFSKDLDGHNGNKFKYLR